MQEPLPPPAVFLDASEYYRNRFSFGGPRFVALRELAASGRVSLLTTDVALDEVRALISRDIRDARDALKARKVSILRSVDDDRFDVLRELPSVLEISSKLISQLDEFCTSASCTTLSVSEVDPAIVFAAYFEGRPPFNNPKKKEEFPDAFTLHRLLGWAKENNILVYVVGPDPDLKAFCNDHSQLSHFDKIEELIDLINVEDALITELPLRANDVRSAVEEYVSSNFEELGFVLAFNPHGDVESVSVTEIEVNDIYALEIANGKVRGEAAVSVHFTADFSYEDPDTGYYDGEVGEYFGRKTVRGSAEDSGEIAVGFLFSVIETQTRVSELQFSEDTFTVREEDRGVYDAYK